MAFFLCKDLGYLGSYHGLTILKHLSIYQECQENFAHVDDYFEHLFGRPRYMGVEMFIMQ
jgi:hypothetical protein